MLDDETSSTASFEDVGVGRDNPASMSRELVVKTPAAKPSDDGEVPDVLYVVQYRDLGGRIVESEYHVDPESLEMPSFSFSL